ncbi:transposase [Rhodocytophaga rosea]|uniref:Transposase n=1 Tax=Rhodocytophaga rosea TaxID=2704465 RepID=A0A6C0GUS2_9BACT|nr:transposase [Rhodocytophaga rosea]QHT71092.1 transposase [Rhodocytophaga rosea]
MNDITQHYINRAEIWLLITTLVYFLMNGAQIFETAVIVPKWTASPPESFQLFKGKYGLDFKPFWIGLHSIHEITFILAIIFCWKLEIRNWLLVLFALHFAVRVWTLIYFAPNIIEFQKIANKSGLETDLLSRAAIWRNLNYIRVGIFIAVSIGLIPLYLKLLQLKVN